MVEWSEYPTPVQEGSGSIPVRVQAPTEYSMDVMIIPPMPCMILKKTVKICCDKTTIKKLFCFFRLLVPFLYYQHLKNVKNRNLKVFFYLI